MLEIRALKFVPKLITPHINKRYSKLRTSIMAPPVNGPNAKATHNAISDIWNTILSSKTDVEFQSDLRQIQFHTLEYVWCPPMYPSMIKHQRRLERTRFQAPYMDQITVEFLKIQALFIVLKAMIHGLLFIEFENILQKFPWTFHWDMNRS